MRGPLGGRWQVHTELHTLFVRSLVVIQTVAFRPTSPALTCQSLAAAAWSWLAFEDLLGLLYWNTRHVTADGLERTFALNYLAQFLLTNLLLDR